MTLCRFRCRQLLEYHKFTGGAAKAVLQKETAWQSRRRRQIRSAENDWLAQGTDPSNNNRERPNTWTQHTVPTSWLLFIFESCCKSNWLHLSPISKWLGTTFLMRNGLQTIVITKKRQAPTAENKHHHHPIARQIAETVLDNEIGNC